MAKQPTANAFIRKQRGWALHVAARISEEINAFEASLRDRGIPVEAWDEYEELMDMYDEVEFWERYAEEMENQREYIKERYL